MKNMSYKIESIKNERNRHGTQETVKKEKSRHRTQEIVPKVGRKHKIQTAAGLNNESKVWRVVGGDSYGYYLAYVAETMIQLGKKNC